MHLGDHLLIPMAVNNTKMSVKLTGTKAKQSTGIVHLSLDWGCEIIELNFRSWASGLTHRSPGRYSCITNFQIYIPHWWWVDIGSGNVLVPSVINPLPWHLMSTDQYEFFVQNNYFLYLLTNKWHAGLVITWWDWNFDYRIFDFPSFISWLIMGCLIALWCFSVATNCVF